MLPVLGLLLFLKQYIVKLLSGPQTVPWDEIADSDLDDDDEEDKDKVGMEVSKHINISIDLIMVAL